MNAIKKLLTVLGFVVWMDSAAAIPVDFVVTVDGTDWAQPALFDGISWNEANAICPDGVCLAGADYHGWNVEGWIWASADEVNGLFNSYLSAAGVSGSDLLGPGVDSYETDIHSTWAPAFFADGWWTNGPVTNFIFETSGLVSTPAPLPDAAYVASLGDTWNFDLTDDFARSDSQVQRDDFTYGAWFYRASDVPGVPSPATLTLFGLALSGLGWTRHKKA